MRAGRAAGTGLAALGATALGALAWGALVERNRFTLRREVVPILNPGARPLTVLHLTDLHMAPWQSAKQDWIASLAVLEPDIVVSTGDNMGHADGLEGLERALGAFRGIPGFFVHGSHDFVGPKFKNPFVYFSDSQRRSDEAHALDVGALERFYEQLGWHDATNTARALSIKGSRLEFVGTGDAHQGADRLDALPGALDDLRENVDWDDGRTDIEPVTIGLTHAPYQRVLNAFVNHSADLIFAGHTHGGQVRVPGLGALVANCDIPLPQAQGMSLWQHGLGASYLNVSAGLGTSIYAPVRFACPPEAVLVTLTGDDFGYS